LRLAPCALIVIFYFFICYIVWPCALRPCPYFVLLLFW
jgi:hypothetical protein